MNRLIKVALVVSASVLCLFYALQNVVNLNAGHAFIAYIVSMQDHIAYPNHFGPAVESSAVVWAMYVIIIVLEVTAGIILAKGAFDLWKARNSSADEFNVSKSWALAGTGLAAFIWFGIFSAIGGAYFQMWQTDAGSGALNNSAQFVLMNGVVWLIVRAED